MRKNYLLFMLGGGIISLFLFINYSLPHKKYNIPVEKIYVINLAKDIERLKVISDKLSSQGLKFERFNAIMGLDLKMEDEHGNMFYGRDLKSKKVSFKIGEKYKIYCPNITIKYEYKPSLSRIGDPLVAGEFGVYCSHLEIMLDVIKNKYKSVIVLEDDADIKDDFYKIIKSMEPVMPSYKKYDLLFLGYAISTNKLLEEKLKIKNIPFNNVLQKITSYDVNVGCVHAINYSYMGASRILDNVVANKGIDLDIFTAVNAGKLSSYKLKNVNIKQRDNVVSSIDSMGDRK